MKELKLSAPRRSAFLVDCLGEALDAVCRSSLRGGIHGTLARSWSQTLFFVLLGVLVFGMPSLHPDRPAVLTGYLLVALYVMTPLWNVIDTWPVIARGGLAVERMTELTTLVEPPHAGEAVPQPGPAWERLDLKGIVFTYTAENGGEPFRLGPLDFSLRPGEIVFVAGGNGSGKSTFAKVLTGLYQPEEGEIRVDGRLVDEPLRDWYRSHFSAIFADFYLFDRLLGLAAPDVDRRAHGRLAELELTGKVRVEAGIFSTTALSSGQRKRLALLASLLEDRPLYVFDEWAADQDPHFRDLFYTRVLPDLRGKGKAVVVISHDDRYYGLGDRTVRLADGQVTA
jgi:putative pyoverdin transport system ATP-binding/permease protein